MFAGKTADEMRAIYVCSALQKDALTEFLEESDPLGGLLGDLFYKLCFRKLLWLLNDQGQVRENGVAVKSEPPMVPWTFTV